MDDALRHAAHDFRFGGLQGFLGGLGVAGGEGFLNLAHVPADAGLTRVVDGLALGGGPGALLGGGDIRHRSVS